MINVLIIDPYYKQVEIAIFQSNKCFETRKSKKFQDIVIKNIMYTTKKSKNDTDFEIKLLTQYTDFISQIELKEEKEQDEVNMSFESEFSDASDDDQETGSQMIKYEHVPLTQND